jgi:hypothetical protein
MKVDVTAFPDKDSRMAPAERRCGVTVQLRDLVARQHGATSADSMLLSITRQTRQ